MSKKDTYTYSAPGRVCLYGEHQDYLRLTVIPAAINLRTVLQITRNSSQTIRVNSQQLSQTDEFTTKKTLQLGNNEFDYLRAIILALYKEKIIESIPGFNITINSEIPIGSGLSSSAALLVSWLTALNDQLSLSLSKIEIANLCFIAENEIMGINCGIMDQFSSSLGGIFSLNCNGPPYEIIPFQTSIEGLIIGDTQIHRLANEPLTQLKTQLFNSIEKIKTKGSQDLTTLSSEDLADFMDILTSDEYKRLLGAVMIREITQEASIELKKNNQDLEKLGELLTRQQRILNENLRVSIPKLDKLIQVSIDAGALGGKLTGAGLGGCIVALAPGNESTVAKAIEKTGGKAFICKIDYSGGRSVK
ncbi:MAG: hypothetical protein FK730_14370 [Asgard group archaeon]|nr:hypothetical protein [Asgard group archaeon]